MKKTIIIALTLILVLASFISCENNTHEHTWDKGTVTKAATCTDKGIKTYTCTVCKETKTEDIAIDPENHTWDKGTVTKAATCTDKGVKTFTCNGCTATKSEALEALGHSWDEGVITKSTYLTKGTKTITCQREGCGETETEELSTIPFSGKVFACYDGNDGKKDHISLLVMEDQQVTTYGGEVDNGSVTATNGLLASYVINIEDKTFTVTPTPGNNYQYELNEYLDSDGNVEIIKMSTGKAAQFLNPMTILETIETGTEEGHYLSVDNRNPISIKVLNGETISKKITLKSISYGPFKHEIVETEPGYLTKGAYNCSVCGFNEAIPVISLEGTKWLSTAPVSAPSNEYINNLYLQIEFIDNTLANISVKNQEDSVANVIESNRPYNVKFDDVAGTATINIHGLYAPNYGGPATEDLQKGQITINITAFNVGNLTFKRIIEEE